MTAIKTLLHKKVGNNWVPMTDDDFSASWSAPISLGNPSYGAIGNGTVDDTAAIQAALDDLAASNTTDRLHIPAGTYLISSYSAHNYAVGIGASNACLYFGRTESVANRDIIITAEPGAVFLMDCGSVSSHMLFIEGRFRSLSIRGLRLEKSGSLQTTVESAEPNGQGGICLVCYDRREIEKFEVDNCTLFNLHRAISIFGGIGSYRENKLKTFRITNSSVLNPYGGNDPTGVETLGHGQQVFCTSWVENAVVTNNYFLGCEDDPTQHPSENPIPSAKDGSWFGSSKNLIFSNNILQNFAVEGVFHVPYQGQAATWTTAFTVPAYNSTVAVTIPNLAERQDHLFEVDDVVVLYDSQENVFVATVTAWSASGFGGTLTVRNDDDGSQVYTNPSAGTELEAGQIYKYAQTDSNVVISSNSCVWNEPYGGSIGVKAIVCSAARAVISSNSVRGMLYGIDLPPEIITPGLERGAGALVSSNVIELNNPDYYSAAGIMRGVYLGQSYSEAKDNMVILKESSKAFAFDVKGKAQNCRFLNNAAIALTKVSNGVSSADRSVGFAANAGSLGNYYSNNRVFNFDVGFGGSNFTTTHQSRIDNYDASNCDLDIDPNFANIKPSTSYVLNKAADESVNNSTLQNDNEFTVPVQRSRNYYVRATLTYTNAAAAGFKFKLIVPTGSIFRGAYSIANSTVTAIAGVHFTSSSTVTTTQSGSHCIVKFDGILQMGSTTGDFYLQWAQNSTDASNPTILTRNSSFIVQPTTR